MNIHKEPYDSIKANIMNSGESYIKTLIENEKESFYVDFKEVVDDYTSKRGFSVSDYKNLAKAVSGFGNSAGGLLIFGIAEDKLIKTFQLKPFSGISEFSKLVNENVSRVTTPPNNYVNSFTVESSSKNFGYVVVEIPKSNFAPLQTIINDLKHQYYMRSGESHVSIPHDVLSGMFGKRPNPILGYSFMNFNYSDNDNICFTIAIRNSGNVIIKNIWVNLSTAEIPGLVYGPNAKMQDIFKGHNLSNSYMSIITVDEFKLPPQVPLAMVDIQIPKKLKKRVGGYAFYFSYGCDGSEPYEFSARFTKNDFTKVSTDGFLEFLNKTNNK